MKTYSSNKNSKILESLSINECDIINQNNSFFKEKSFNINKNIENLKSDLRNNNTEIDVNNNLDKNDFNFYNYDHQNEDISNNLIHDKNNNIINHNLISKNENSNNLNYLYKNNIINKENKFFYNQNNFNSYNINNQKIIGNIVLPFPQNPNNFFCNNLYTTNFNSYNDKYQNIILNNSKMRYYNNILPYFGVKYNFHHQSNQFINNQNNFMNSRFEGINKINISKGDNLKINQNKNFIMKCFHSKKELIEKIKKIYCKFSNFDIFNSTMLNFIEGLNCFNYSSEFKLINYFINFSKVSIFGMEVFYIYQGKFF